MNAIKSETRLTPEQAKAAGEKLAAVIENIEQVIIGKRTAIELVLIALIAKGHVLIEDVPGVGKTSLVSAIAKSVDCLFKRIQFTPDLMPSDVTGFSIYNQKSGEFQFCPGGVMGNIILADEINRASAKTQASLLEAMEEGQVTVDSKTYLLEEPFMVLATQNPVESFGTYPLPEAQLDRFLMKISIGYLSQEEEAQMIAMPRRKMQGLSPVVTRQEVTELSSLAERVYVAPSLARYIVGLVSFTRTSADTVLGSSARGSIALYHAAQAMALLRGREYVLPDDVKYLAPSVLAHRLILSHEAKTAKKTAGMVVGQALESVLVPTDIE